MNGAPPALDPRLVLRARITVAGQPAVLAVGLHAVGVRFGTSIAASRDPVVLVSDTPRAVAQAVDALAVTRALVL